MLLWGFVYTLSGFTFRGHPEAALTEWSTDPSFASEYCGTLPLSFSVVAYHPDTLMIVEDQLCASQRTVGLYNHRRTLVHNENELRRLFLQNTPPIALSPDTAHVKGRLDWHSEERTTVTYDPRVQVLGGPGDERGTPERISAQRPPKVWMARMDHPDDAPVELVFKGDVATFILDSSDLLVVQRMEAGLVVTRTSVPPSR